MNDRPPPPVPADTAGGADAGEPAPPPRRSRRLRGYPARGEDISEITAEPPPSGPASVNPAMATDPDPAAPGNKTA
jgi:hypothetical protein